MVKKFYIAITIALVLAGCAPSMASRKAFIEANPQLLDWQKQAILDRKIWVGMTIEELLATAGKPTTINSSYSASGARSQWIYRSIVSGGPTTYVYVEGGKVTSMDFYR